MSTAGVERMWTDRIYTAVAAVGAALMLGLAAMDMFVSRTDCLGGWLTLPIYLLVLAANTIRYLKVLFPARAARNYPPPGCPRMFWLGSLIVMAKTAWDGLTLPLVFIAAWLFPLRVARPVTTYDARILIAQAILYGGAAALFVGGAVDQIVQRAADVQMCLGLPIAVLVAAGALIATAFLYLRAPPAVATHDTTALPLHIDRGEEPLF